jgi:hypothetical protein
MARSRGDTVAIGFMVVWLVFWTAGILIALYLLGGLVLRGELVPGLVLVAWLAAAGYGLVAGVMKLRALILHGKRPSKLLRDHAWKDGVNGPRSGPDF